MEKMYVVKIDENSSVLIKEGKIEAWIDVWISNGDVQCDWNKYIFYDYNHYNPNDVALKNWQDNPDNFLEASSLALEALEYEGIIWQNSDGSWGSNLTN